MSRKRVGEVRDLQGGARLAERGSKEGLWS